MSEEPENLKEMLDSIQAEALPYPLDIDKLERGQTLLAEECEQIIGVHRLHRTYDLRLLALREWIMQESARRRRPLSVCCKKGGLHINTDPEAAEYHARLAADGERKIGANFARMCRTVRPGQLGDLQRQAHETNIRVWALKWSALKSAEIGADQLPAAIGG
jgi:citrate synthase